MNALIVPGLAGQLFELVAAGEEKKAVALFSGLSDEQKTAIIRSVPVTQKLAVLQLENSEAGVRKLLRGLHHLEIAAVTIPEIGNLTGSAVAFHLNGRGVKKIIRTLIIKDTLDHTLVLELLMMVHDADENMTRWPGILRGLPNELLAYIHRRDYLWDATLGYGRYASAEQLFVDLENFWPKKHRSVRRLADGADPHTLVGQLYDILASES